MKIKIGNFIYEKRDIIKISLSKFIRFVDDYIIVEIYGKTDINPLDSFELTYNNSHLFSGKVMRLYYDENENSTKITAYNNNYYLQVSDAKPINFQGVSLRALISNYWNDIELCEEDFFVDEQYSVRIGTSLYDAVADFSPYIIRVADNKAYYITHNKKIKSSEQKVISYAKSFDYSNTIDNIKFKSFNGGEFDRECVSGINGVQSKYVNLISVDRFQRNNYVKELLNKSFNNVYQLNITLDGIVDIDIGDFIDDYQCVKIEFEISGIGKLTKITAVKKIDIKECVYAI